MYSFADFEELKARYGERVVNLAAAAARTHPYDLETALAVYQYILNWVNIDLASLTDEEVLARWDSLHAEATNRRKAQYIMTATGATVPGWRIVTGGLDATKAAAMFNSITIAADEITGASLQKINQTLHGVPRNRSERRALIGKRRNSYDGR